MADLLPHEYGPTRVGHGEAQCIHCFGTNRENAIIEPNGCAARTAKAPPAPAREQGAACANCGRPVEVGQVVLVWDEAGDMHADCDRPFALSHKREQNGPAPMLLIGDPMELVPLPVDFQLRVAPWMQECFGPTISADRVERADRLLEEVLELLQSGGYDAMRIAQLVAYVFGRDVGEPVQEVGGVMVTLAAYCLAHDLDMHDAGEVELARVWTKVDQIREKQRRKAETIGASPLPQAPTA